MLASAALLGGCAGRAARDADRAYTGGLARIERVEAELVSLRPARLRVVVRGSVPDACTEVEPPRIRPLGARIEITLETRRPFGASCPPQPQRFRRSIPLMIGGEFQFYVIDVNGTSQSVTVPPEPDLLR